MDPNTKGWLRNYCEMIDWEKGGAEGSVLSHYEEVLYRTLQPSGIMYGHPVRDLAGLLTEQVDLVGRMKLIFAESLIRTGSLRLEATQPSLDVSRISEQLVPEISDYFLNLYPDLYQSNTSSYLNKPYFLAENLIGKRITIKTSLVKNYLANLFHNSMLFLDVFFFGEWVSGPGSSSAGQLREEKERFRLTILGIMALAAQADRELQREEKALFEFFLQSASLSAEMEKEARSMLGSVRDLHELDIPKESSWLLRKYLLEMAILVTCADRKLNEQEHDFIEQLGVKLDFSLEEISESMLAVESFVLDNWSRMHYLLGKHNLEMVSSRFMIRMKGFVNKNKNYVVQEIRESKELFYLLGKSRTSSLTKIEKKIVNEQLIDILKTIPAFVIIALPFTFITLPMLLTLLPKTAFPSSFQE